jgi:hypothetical protein
VWPDSWTWQLIKTSGKGNHVVQLGSPYNLATVWAVKCSLSSAGDSAQVSVAVKCLTYEGVGSISVSIDSARVAAYAWWAYAGPFFAWESTSNRAYNLWAKKVSIDSALYIRDSDETLKATPQGITLSSGGAQTVLIDSSGIILWSISSTKGRFTRHELSTDSIIALIGFRGNGTGLTNLPKVSSAYKSDTSDTCLGGAARAFKATKLGAVADSAETSYTAGNATNAVYAELGPVAAAFQARCLILAETSMVRGGGGAAFGATAAYALYYDSVIGMPGRADTMQLSGMAAIGARVTVVNLTANNGAVFVKNRTVIVATLTGYGKYVNLDYKSTDRWFNIGSN